ncbi:MAG: hypothetical protein DRI44_03350 [Chlamydiae bacterium]|nr:MAG: hypothetical protein DRI44_03350 [Chlamydiota bacterium]
MKTNQFLKVSLFVPVLVFFIAALSCSASQPVQEPKMEHVISEVGAGYEVLGVPPVMRKVLWGLNVPIQYRAEVEKGGKYVVIFAFFENYYGRAKQRVMQLNIEGAEKKIVDVPKMVGRKKTLAVDVFASDADKNGWLDISVDPYSKTKDHVPVLAGVWVFDVKDWQAQKMTAEKVLNGNFDSIAYYFVDCGSDESLYPILTFKKRIAPIVSGCNGLFELAKHDKEISKLYGDKLKKIKIELKNLKKLLTEKKFKLLIQKFAATQQSLNQIRDSVKPMLVEKYKPELQTSAQTHLASPWGALVKVRQEDKLKLMLDVLPQATSLEHKYHPQYATRDLFGWIEIATSAEARNKSTKLCLNYDIGLRDIDYDPLLTKYRYCEGDVDVQIMDKAAVRVWSPKLSLHVKFDLSKLSLTNNLLSGEVKSIHNVTLYYAVIFKDKKIETLRKELSTGNVDCNGFTVFWADSVADLKLLSKQIADWKTSQKTADAWAKNKTKNGRVSGPAKLANRTDIDKRTFLTMGFQFGGTYAALDGGYQAIWVRDTTIVNICTALSGDPQFLKRWTPYLLANPTPAEVEGKKYKTFIIAPYAGRHIFKMEDDGPAYAILSAYAYWKLLGDDSKLAEWYKTLDSAMQFLAVKSYSKKMGLYSESFINEAPLKESPYWKDEKVPGLKIGDDWPMRVYSIYINNLMYASHLMMGEMAIALNKNSKSKKHFEQAEKLAKTIDKKLWNPKENIYWTGIAVMDDGKEILVDLTYFDIFLDYAWAFALYPITPNAKRSLDSINFMMNPRLPDSPFSTTKHHTSIPYGYSACVYTWGGEFKKAKTALEYLADASQRLGYNPTMKALYAMKGAMFEWTTIFHCHRPQVFSAAPCLYGIVSLGASVDYNGVNIMPSGYLNRIDDLIFKKSVLNIDLKTPKNLGGIVVDDKEVPYTLRIPSNLLTPGTHQISFLNKKCQPLLLYTNLELLDVKDSSESVEYTINGYGNGVLRFKNVSRDKISATDISGKPVAFDYIPSPTGDFIQITTKGKPITLKIKKQ